MPFSLTCVRLGCRTPPVLRKGKRQILVRGQEVCGAKSRMRRTSGWRRHIMLVDPLSLLLDRKRCSVLMSVKGTVLLRFEPRFIHPWI